MTKRNHRSFTPEFKKEIVQLYEGKKPRQEIIREYELTSSSFDLWVSQYHDSGSFKEEDNRSPEEKELIKLKENQRLNMKNDILKQAALIMGRK